MEGLALKTANRICENWADAEDAVQQANDKAVRGIDALKRLGSFDAWYLAIVRNEARQLVRGRKPHEPLKEADLPVSLRPAGLGHEVDCCLLIDEVRKKVPDDDWEIFVSRHVEGLLHKEIAAIHEISISTVKRRLTKTRRLISRILSAN